LRSIHSNYFFAVLINGDICYFRTVFYEVSWVNNGVCFILFTLLHIFAVFDTIIHRSNLSLVFTLCEFFVFILLDFVGEEVLHILIVGGFIIKDRTLRFAIKV
jgi:hypothetical protein